MLHKKQRTWVVMADSACARILASEGDGFEPVEGGFFENPTARLHTRDLGTDRPARTIESVGGARHAIEPHVDWRREDRIGLAEQVSAFVENAAREKKFDRIVLAAPPAMLGHLRAALGQLTAQRVAAELRKDLIKMPAAQLSTELSQALRP